MITLTLELNKRCNLACEYCYIGEKDNRSMSLRTAIGSIDFAIERINIENHRYRTIRVNFLGGEPLLSIKEMEEVVSYCEVNKEKQHVDFEYTVTTNGVLLNREITQFLIDHHFSLKVSLDGDEKINDLSRKTIYGTGSYRSVVKNLNNIKFFEMQTRKAVQVSSVITRKNYTYLLESIRHFHEDLGFLDIDAGIDIGPEWTEQEIEKLSQILNEVLTYYVNSYKQNKYFMWRYIENALDNYENKSVRLYSCGAGIISFYVNTEGDMFLCPNLLKYKYSLGNVFDGFSEFGHLVRNKLKDVKDIDNAVCRECKENEICKVKGCFASSLYANDDINIPDRYACLYGKIVNSIVEKNVKILEEIRDNAKIIGPKGYSINIDMFCEE